ncbi:MAG: HD domain-containing protein [Olsenella sp.]|nr:HD domain-containing protein [Olsenella sp.]
MAGFVQHGQTTTLDHVAAVAYLSLFLVRGLGLRCDERSLVRGALLHDYYLYDWHDHQAAPDNWHGFTHPRHALRNAERDFPDLTNLERDIIAHHMFPLVPSPPRHREALVVSLADKICSTVEVFARQPWRRIEKGGPAW